MVDLSLNSIAQYAIIAMCLGCGVSAAEDGILTGERFNLTLLQIYSRTYLW